MSANPMDRSCDLCGTVRGPADMWPLMLTKTGRVELAGDKILEPHAPDIALCCPNRPDSCLNKGIDLLLAAIKAKKDREAPSLPTPIPTPTWRSFLAEEIERFDGMAPELRVRLLRSVAAAFDVRLP